MIFGHWIFTLAATLAPGTGLDWPVMAAQRLAPPAIHETIVWEDVWTPGTVCATGDPACVPTPGGFTGGRGWQSICVQPGVYVVHFRLGLQPGPAAGGHVWLHGPGGQVVHLTDYRASPDAWPLRSTSAALAADTASCWSLRYEGWGTATINPDPRVTLLTVHRAGA